MKVKELKAALKDLGLSAKGKKAELEARLADAKVVEEEEVEEVEVADDSEEEETPEEVVEEEEPMDEPIVEEIDYSDCKCEWCAQGYAHREPVVIEKLPDRPSTEWNLAKYGKQPNGAFVRHDGTHVDHRNQPLEELEE